MPAGIGLLPSVGTIPLLDGVTSTSVAFCPAAQGSSWKLVRPLASTHL
ncbi:MAG: hypothetical protein RSD57_18060 [Comamonas sp.]